MWSHQSHFRQNCHIRSLWCPRRLESRVESVFLLRLYLRFQLKVPRFCSQVQDSTERLVYVVIANFPSVFFHIRHGTINWVKDNPLISNQHMRRRQDCFKHKREDEGRHKDKDLVALGLIFCLWQWFWQSQLSISLMYQRSLFKMLFLC